MKKLSRETGEKLINLLENIAIELEDGTNPTDLLYKYAKNNNLSEHYIRLLARAINVGRTNSRLFDDNSDFFSKTSSFLLADAETVINRLRNESKLSPSKKTASCVVSPDYYLPPQQIIPEVYSKLNKIPNLEKVAKIVDSTALLNNDSGLSFSELLSSIKKYEAIRSQIAELRDKLLLKASEFVNYSKTIDPNKTLTTLYNFKILAGSRPAAFLFSLLKDDNAAHTALKKANYSSGNVDFRLFSLGNELIKLAKIWLNISKKEELLKGKILRDIIEYDSGTPQKKN